MDGGQGYGVRIRQPRAAGDEWAADLSVMIAPIIGEDADTLEAALGRGELIVAQGLPMDEAKQLVAVFQSLGAEAEVVDRAGSDAPRPGLPPRPGDKPAPMAGTQPFNMAGLRKALQAAARSAPPLGVPADEADDLPPLPDFDPPPEARPDIRHNATRPFDPSMVRAALARAGEAADDGPGDLPSVLGHDEEEDDIPTSIKGPGAERRRAPGYASGLMGVLDETPSGPPAPGPTQAFGAGMYEPPPPPPRAGEGAFDGPPPPDRGALAGFATPDEPFDPKAVRRLRDGGRRRGFSGPPDLLDGPSMDEFDTAPRRGAAIGDKPTDRLMMPPGLDPPGPALRGELRGDFDDLPLPPLSAPEPPPPDLLDPVRPRRPMPSGPMVVQLDAPVVDPSETGTFTREASLDPLASEDEETRQVGAIRDEDLAGELPDEGRELRKAAPQRGVRPGVYQIDRERRAADGRVAERSRAGAAILSTGQMLARPVASPDEEVTDSGSFRIVQRDEDGGTKRSPRAQHAPARAALLSLVLPGMGQVYNGQRDRGIAFALAAVLVVPWLYAIVDAWTTAAAIRDGRRPRPDPKAWARGRSPQLLLNIAVIFSVVVGYTIWRGMQDPPAPVPATPPAAPAAPPG